MDFKILLSKCQIGELCCSARGGAQGSMIALGFQMSRCQGVRRDAERSMGSGVHEIKGSQSPWIQGCMDGSRHGVLEGVPKSRGPEVPMWFSFLLLAHGSRSLRSPQAEARASDIDPYRAATRTHRGGPQKTPRSNKLMKPCYHKTSAPPRGRARGHSARQGP